MTRLMFALGGALGGALIMHLMDKQSLQFPAQHPAARKQPDKLTPARAAIHGDLVNNCVDPNKLQRAATLFGAEGLLFEADVLLRKAMELHEMMHGARSIVERCRAGDQHAMAMAKGIGDQARAGNKRAQVSSFFIEEYTKAYPNLDASYYDEAPPPPMAVVPPVAHAA